LTDKSLYIYTVLWA